MLHDHSQHKLATEQPWQQKSTTFLQAVAFTLSMLPSGDNMPLSALLLSGDIMAANDSHALLCRQLPASAACCCVLPN